MFTNASTVKNGIACSLVYEREIDLGGRRLRHIFSEPFSKKIAPLATRYLKQ